MSVQEIIDFIEQLGKIIDYIERIGEEYELRYGTPNYVKIPLWIFNALRVTKKMLCAYTGDDDVEVKKIAGLTVCPTLSIEKIEEIEVF